jgi:hypothetical protein
MRKLISGLLFSIVILACGKTGLNSHGPIENNGATPGAVTNVKVVNLPGAAILTYTLPKDANLQYVLAEYRINDSATRQAKASRYGDSIHVDGFSKAGAYEVKLYAVSKSEIKSAPVSVTVNPSTPPYRVIAATLQIHPDFGGVNITFDNAGEDKIALVIITKDNNKEFSAIETFYTQQKNGSFSIRGYDTTQIIFGAYIKDRWDNYSDTVFATIKPLFETQLDKNKFRKYVLPSDQPSAWGWEMENLWDNKYEEPGFHTLQGNPPEPHRFTFDIGVVAQLSRFKLLQRKYDWLYIHGNPRLFTIWGTATPPDPSGSWNGWTKLADCESIKPSGSPAGVVTDEDVQHALGPDGKGEEYLIPLSAPAVRYIRLEIHSNWSNTDFFHALELTFYGNLQ